MLTYHACSKCDSPVRRSRRKNILEFLVGPIMLPYRCTICDRREMKLRFIDMEPGTHSDDEDDLLITEPTERELEDERKAEQRAAEKAAKKAAKMKKEETAKEKPAAKAAAAASPQSNTSDEEEEQISPS